MVKNYYFYQHFMVVSANAREAGKNSPPRAGFCRDTLDRHSICQPRM
jgi:hypothetical protein